MKQIKLLFALFAMLALSVGNAWAQTVTWEKATSIAAGDVVVLVCESKKMELSGISTTSTKYGMGVAYTSTPAGKYELTVEAGSSYGTFSFKNGSDYLYWFTGNSLNKTTTKNSNASWKVTFSSGNATILNAKDNARKLQWNASSPRFACYTTSQTAVQLYKKVISDEPADVIVKTLKSIAVEGMTTDYETGDIFKFDGTCTATYSVTKNDVAQEDETKVVTPTLVSTPDMSTAGEKEVTVTYTEDDVTVTATYTITVTENVITAGEYKLALNNTFFGCGTGNNETEQLKKSNDILVTAGCLSSASSKTYYHANHVRFYADSYLKLSVPEGYVINSIVFTADGDWKGSISVNAGTYTDDTKSWAGSVQEVVFSFGAQNRIATATVTYEALADDVTYDYYIAGTENLTGFNWSANGLGMEKDGDVYKHTFRELNSGIYEFKITDGQFNSEGDKTHEHTTLGAAYEEVSYNDGNIKIITEEAINLTVIFDATAGKITFEGLTLKRYTVEATVNPAEVGTIEGAGTYTHGAEATLTATPAEGYKFVNWTVGEETIADNPYKFAVTADVALVANFEKLTHTVNATATNGTVTGAGTYNHGAEVTLTATPAFDYEFVKWSNGETANPLTITVEKNIELQAIFAEVAATEVKESGKFSISAHKTATFATGNLQYHTGDTTWRFAKQQYQVVGEQNINLGDSAFSGWIDMFGWSTSETYFGVDPSNSNELYDGEFVDWGKVFEGENWSTLSADEWKYLLNTRENADSLKQTAKVDTIIGLLLFPDGWVMPEGVVVEAEKDKYFEVDIYNYTLEQWTKLEQAGALFLPAAGRRAGGYGNMINYDQVEETNPENLNGEFYRWQDNTNIYCYYWTSTINEDKNVSYLHNIVALGNDEYTIGTGAIWGEKGRYGQSVRLAKVETVEIIEPVKTIEWVLNGGDFPAVVVPTNDSLWAAFKPYYNEYYGLARADQPIDKVSTFASAKMQEIMTDEASEYKWLGDYVQSVATAAGVPLSTDMTAANEGGWRWAVHAFFNAAVGQYGAAGTDFTNAGKPEVWGAAYQAAYGVVLPTEAVEADYTLPTPVKTGFTFVGWYDNAEGEGDAMTVLKAGWSGTIYAIWKQDSTTGVENTVVAEQVVKIVRNGQVLIMVGDKTFNMMGQEVK